VQFRHEQGLPVFRHDLIAPVLYMNAATFIVPRGTISNVVVGSAITASTSSRLALSPDTAM
jgi:hypothetical protein